MKTSMLLLAFATIVFAGCSTPQSVSRLHGRGSKMLYDEAFEPVWRAAIVAAQEGDMEIVSTDKAHGYIATHRPMATDSFGENDAIWVRRITPHQTLVEVVSRPVGPPMFEYSNGEHRVLNSIAADLTTSTAGL
ncbi:MAG TPA: hypothetical protein VFB72_08235 [Verrucomicrobiae bacterium]|nr:hypothetical protein [Verrucomicrobiae bacterium]